MKEERTGIGGGGSIADLMKELWQATVKRDASEPADYKRYVLPVIFLRFLSLRPSLMGTTEIAILNTWTTAPN